MLIPGRRDDTEREGENNQRENINQHNAKQRKQSTTTLHQINGDQLLLFSCRLNVCQCCFSILTVSIYIHFGFSDLCLFNWIVNSNHALLPSEDRNALPKSPTSHTYVLFFFSFRRLLLCFFLMCSVTQFSPVFDIVSSPVSSVVDPPDFTCLSLISTPTLVLACSLVPGPVLRMLPLRVCPACMPSVDLLKIIWLNHLFLCAINSLVTLFLEKDCYYNGCLVLLTC